MNEFNTTFGALCDEFGVNPESYGFCEDARDWPITLCQDADGAWHIDTYNDQLNDEDWAPDAEQAERLQLKAESP